MHNAFWVYLHLQSKHTHTDTIHSFYRERVVIELPATDIGCK